MNQPVDSTIPASLVDANLERLRLQAIEQRRQIHRSVSDLKTQVSQVRHDLDPATNVRRHFVGASLIAGGACFALGYGFGGFFIP